MLFITTKIKETGDLDVMEYFRIKRKKMIDMGRQKRASCVKNILSSYDFTTDMRHH